jgi:glycosyltransferase involved in cell wall biosynthesis
MKIVHVVYSLEMGGAEVIVAQLCRIQRAQGHQPSVIAYSKLGVIGEALVAEGFSVHVPGAAHPFRTMLRYFKLFRRLRPDVVHCHNVAPTIQASLAARLAGVPAVISTRHRLELHPYNRSSERKYNLACRACHWVTGICQVTCDNIAIGPFAQPKKIVLVYNGTDPVVPAPSTELVKTGFTLLFIGRLVREKDLPTLLRALAIARSTVPGLTCWIVGEGNVRADLEALSAELDLTSIVRLWGLRTDTAQFFSAADTFIMSSISEGLPMSLLQAMSLSLPSILTDVDGMGEVLRLTHSGLLTPVGDPSAMAAAIHQMATDPSLRANFAGHALAAYQQHFTLEKMNAGYLHYYHPHP